jgi:hypothetical protein
VTLVGCRATSINSASFPVLNAVLDGLGCFQHNSSCSLQNISVTWSCSLNNSDVTIACDTNGNIIVL